MTGPLETGVRSVISVLWVQETDISRGYLMGAQL